MLLLDFVELNNASFPCLVQDVELGLFLVNNLKMELIKLLVFESIFLFFVAHLLLHELINLWRQVKCNINQFLSHAVNIGARTFLLECL